MNPGFGWLSPVLQRTPYPFHEISALRERWDCLFSPLIGQALTAEYL